MAAWYEFEEIVGRRWHRWAVRAASYPCYPEAAVSLKDLRDTLAVYFRASGGPGAITPVGAAARDSTHRLTLRQKLGLEREPLELARRDDEHLMLPERLAYFPDRTLNRDLYFWLTAFLAEARPLPKVVDPLQADLLTLAEAWRVSESVCRALPGLARRYRRLCRALLRIRPERRLPPVETTLERITRHLLGSEQSLDRSTEALLELVTAGESAIGRVNAPQGYHPPLPVPLWGQVVTVRSGGSRDSCDDPETGGAASEAATARKPTERRHLEQTERDDPLLLNPFEKMLSWTEMVNVNRHVEDDDEDDAKKAAEQLEQLTLSKHRKPAATRLKMELEIAPEAVEESTVEASLRYPEWHYRKRAYLPDYCAVQVRIGNEAEQYRQADAATRRRIRRVRRQFEALRPRREHLRGQIDGHEFDLDALVRSRTEQAAGGPGSEKVHMDWRDQSRDLAVAILVDVSLSTDALVEDRRVLDVEKEALLVLAHGIRACGDDQAIFTFTSRRRHRVDITTIKDFDEALDERIERRIAALRPGLYTRMGTAVRHVSARLARRPDRHRLLLMLTDGKPNDTDHYEGRFAIEDTRMAVREARRQGLTVFGVTVGAEARQYFPVIFGRGGYAIVARPAALVTALPALYRQLVGR